MNTRKMVLTALFVAIGIALPQSLHIIGGPTIGATLLPMHLPVFIGAMLLGPTSGMIIALLSVGVGFLLGMPPLIVVSYMIFELVVYAFVSGWLYHKLKMNIFVSYFIAKIAGMLTALVVLQIMMILFNVQFPPVFGKIAMFYAGAIGIVLQVFIIPTVVLLLEKEMNISE